MAAARAGLLRTSWHVYNTDADVDAVLALLTRPEKTLRA
jgi:selenocysteine lyase/cysteine desulfurase